MQSKIKERGLLDPKQGFPRSAQAAPDHELLCNDDVWSAKRSFNPNCSGVSDAFSVSAASLVPDGLFDRKVTLAIG
jgi:hypothetical protein